MHRVLDLRPLVLLRGQRQTALMCGGYAIRNNRRRWDRLDGLVLGDEGEWLPSRNQVRPGEMVPIVTGEVSEISQREVLWGRVTRRHPRPLINARAETVFDKPTFKQAIRQRRCLVPADGWYEWVAEKTGPLTAAEARASGLTRAGKRRKFYRFSTDQPFWMAGIYGGAEMREGDDYRSVQSLIILTTAACPQIAASGHHRQPILFDKQDCEQWLHEPVDTADGIKKLLLSRDYYGLEID